MADCELRFECKLYRHTNAEYQKWGLEDAARAIAPPAIAVVVEQAPPPANAVVVEQVPEARQDSDSDLGYSPLPGGQEVPQEATSNVLEALDAGEDLIYSPGPSDARSDKEEGEMEEEESGVQGHFSH